MKKGILKFLAGTAAIATLIGGAPLSVQAAATDTPKATLVTDKYYKTLLGEEDEESEASSLTLKKYKNGSESKAPIDGVEFRYAKVGDLYQIVDGNKISMAYGVEAAFAAAFKITAAADYHITENGDMYYYKDINKINTQYLQSINLQTETSLKEYIGGTAFTSVTTGSDGNASGTAKIENADYGLYAVVEWSSANASINGEKVSLTNIQSPFLIALPTYVTTNEGEAYWEKNVTAEVKNSTDEPETEKKIVTANEDKTDGSESVDDTDITSIGDTVHFRLKGTVPNIPTVANGNKEQFKKYILVDNLSKGLTPETEEDGIQLKNVIVRTTNNNYSLENTDEVQYYTTKVENYTGTEPEYIGGKTIAVTLTEEGLKRISNWAAADAEETTKEIYFYYTAVVNENVKIGPDTQISGPAGNPNEVKLQYKIGSSADMETDWDKVTEYTFGIKADKQLAGSAAAVTDSNKNAITFVLYSTKDGKAETTGRTYYEMKKVSDGVYHVTSKTETSAENNTKIHPAAGGALNIKGLEEGTYFLEELSTVSGYNLLKAPVKIKITAKTGNNTYVLDGKEENNNQYIGTISQDGNTDGIFKVTINNIKGFELPSTGGSGIWFFVLAGAFAVAAGCVYYSMTIRKNRAK